ncbi:FAD-dependent oxidoreductase [Micrococcales bacterium 31B]|nr:FAD-dependent oxidoreductase [Micrococcales bacterium 31B]
MQLGDAKVVVVGGGIAGLVAAREFAKAGCRVAVYEAEETCGGAVKLHSFAGIPVDAGAESIATAHAAAHELLAELRMSERIVKPLAAPAWLVNPSGANPLPSGGIWGIPPHPLAEDVVNIIGREAALVAARDLIEPLSLEQRERFADPDLSLGELVASRLGDVVLARLVSPVVMGVHSAHPDDLQADLLAPGLREQCLESGGLQAAVQALLARRAASAPTTAGAAVMGLRGGVGTLSERLVDNIIDLGGTVVTNSVVTGLTQRTTTGRTRRPRYRVTVKGYLDSGLTRGFEAGGGRIRFDNDASYAVTLVEADVVFFAVPPNIAQPIVHDVAPRAAKVFEAEPPATVVHLATLLVEAPAWDAAPRGTGALVAAGVPGVTAKALTHQSAKWGWLADDLRELVGPGHHLVRLSYRDEPGSVTSVLREAEAILGPRGSDANPLAFTTLTWAEQQAVRYPGHARAVAKARKRLAAESQGADHLAVIGAWAAGSGIGPVIGDAVAESRRVLDLLAQA